jgi:hypothetical protein
MRAFTNWRGKKSEEEDFFIPFKSIRRESWCYHLISKEIELSLKTTTGSKTSTSIYSV